MAIGLNALTSGSDDTDQTVYTTASITPSANALILIWVATSSAGAPPTVTVSGASLTWVEVVNVDMSNRKLTLLRAMSASPGSGTLTLTCSAASSNCAWSVVELTGVDTGGTNGSGAVVQFPTVAAAAATSASITLSAAGNSNNRPVSGFSHRASEATTPRTNWTEVHDLTFASPSMGLETQWRSDTFETTASASWATAATSTGIAAEIKAGGTAHNASLSESVGGTDAITRAAALARALAEPIGGTEAVARAVTYARALADSAPATDAITSVRGPARNIADSAPATDAVTRQLAAARALAESAPASETVTRAAALSRSLANAAPATDAIAALSGITRGLADSAPASDAVARTLSYARALANSAPATDAIGFQLIGGAQSYSRSIADSAPATDALGWFRYWPGPTTADIEITIDTPRGAGTSATVPV